VASNPAAVISVYEHLPLDALRRVADSYTTWYVARVTERLDEITAGLRIELRENDAKEASFCPSPREQEIIARLQQTGVTGTELLDRLVDQGEGWLILTMQRLDHFERTGMAPKDYSTWCEHALSGAYDWIDVRQLQGQASAPAGRPGVR
jgi:hypothetical protein